MSKTAITAIATLSYPHLDTAQPGKAGQKSKFSAALVWTPETLQDPKERARFLATEAAVLEAAEEKFPGKGAEMLRTGKLRSPFRKDAEAKGYAPGSIFTNARTVNQPGAVYSYPEPGSNPPKPAKVAQTDIKKVFYPGAQVRASVAAYYYDVDGSKGIALALNNIQFVRDGERLDNRVSAENEFEADLSAAPASLESLLS